MGMNAQYVVTQQKKGTFFQTVCPLTMHPEAEEESFHENHVVNIYPDLKYQTIDGFGGALTESSGSLLNHMEPSVAQNLINDLFSREGANFRFLRMHVDSCDFCLSEYQSVEDPIADPEFRTFSIDRDRQYTIPWVKQAAETAENPLEVVLSPWSPPYQWKTPPHKPKNDSAVYGGFAEKFLPKVDYTVSQRSNGGSLKREHYGDWASYLVRFIQAYLDEGIPVTMLTIQNESVAATIWDSCVWTPQEQKIFLKDYLYPAMEKAGLTSKVGIYVWDHNKERAVEYCAQLLDEQTLPLVEGIAFHWYSGDHFGALDALHQMYPDKKLMLTECCHMHAPEKSRILEYFSGKRLAFRKKKVALLDAADYAHEIIGDLNAGMHRWIDWNLCLNPKGGPRHVMGGVTAPIVVEPKGTYRKTSIYWYVRQFSRYIQPGAVRLGTSTPYPNLEATAAKNPDGSVAVVLLNYENKAHTVSLRMDGWITQLKLKPFEIVTVVFSA